MKTIDLTAFTREEFGKGPARRCRRQGRVPAILYGVDIDPVPLTVASREFVHAARREKTVHMMVNLKFDGNGRTEMALVRQVQRDPVSGYIIHIDFMHVSPNRKLKLTVPVHLRGTAEGVKTHGGILQHIMRELEIESLPANIPEFIEFDVSPLGIGDTIHVQDVSVERITILSDPRRTVVSVVPPTVIKEPVAEAPVEAEAAGAPELVGEEEKAEEKPAEGEGTRKEEKEKKKEK